jgi:hypothetical protein
MTETFRNSIATIGGVRIGKYVLTPAVNDWTYYLLAEDGGEVMKVTTANGQEHAVEFCHNWLTKNPSPRITYCGPPSDDYVAAF